MNIRQRQAEGIAAAKKRGVKFGRPPIPKPDNFDEMYKLMERQKNNSPSCWTDKCGILYLAFYRFANDNEFFAKCIGFAISKNLLHFYKTIIAYLTGFVNNRHKFCTIIPFYFFCKTYTFFR